MAKENQERAEESFIEGEDEDSDGAAASKVAARSGGEREEDKGEDKNEVDAARGAVGELDEGGDGGVMLDDGSVAKRPVIAAASAGAGGANGGSPDDDGDVVRENTPREAAQRARNLRGG